MPKEEDKNFQPFDLDTEIRKLSPDELRERLARAKAILQSTPFVDATPTPNIRSSDWDEKGVAVYDQPWEKVFGPGEKIGSGNVGEVYRPLDPQFRDRVIKVFNKSLVGNPYWIEVNALTKLQGANHVVKIMGHDQIESEQYLVKEFIDGENMEEVFNSSAFVFPSQPGERVTPEQQKLAIWLVSSMEALAEIHARKVIVSDFKFADFPWDPKRGKTVVIDLANAWDKEHISYSGQRSEMHDIGLILNLFFYKTGIGRELGMEHLYSFAEPTWPGQQALPNQETLRLLKTKAERPAVSDSLKKIITMFEGIHEWPQRLYSAGEYAQALKEYFQEVGLYTKNVEAPTPDVGASSQEREPKDWLELIKKNVLIVGRNGKIFPRNMGEYTDDTPQFPNPDKFPPFPLHGSRLFYYGEGFLEKISHKVDPTGYKTHEWELYPILYINPVHTLENQSNSIGQFVNISYVSRQAAPNPIDPREGPVHFYLCFNQEFGDIFSKALMSDSVPPEVFLQLYDTYFPKVDPETGAQRRTYQEITGGKELLIIKGKFERVVDLGNPGSTKKVAKNVTFTKVPFPAH